MDRRKKALLVLLTLVFIALASLSIAIAVKVLRGEYIVASEDVSLLMLLIFLSYASAELTLFLRAKFENEKQSPVYRIVVLIYLLMLLVFVIAGILFYGEKKESEKKGEPFFSSIPPEVEDGQRLSHSLIEDEVDSIAKEDEPIALLIVEDEEEETTGKESAMVEETETDHSIIVIGEETTAKAEKEEAVAVVEDVEMNREEGMAIDVIESTKEEKPVLVPEPPTISSVKACIKIPTAPTFSSSINQSMYEPYVPPRWEDEDFWSTFYIEGESEVILTAGIYYFDLYVNGNYTGAINTYIDEKGEVSVLLSDLRELTSPLITEEAVNRICSYAYDYIPLSLVSDRGVETSYDNANYAIYLNFDSVDMPIQIISIRGSASRYVYRPIAGAEVLEPAAFTLTTRHNLSGSASVTPVTSFVPSLYLSYSASNSFRIYDLYGNFSLYATYNSGSFNFRLGSYTFYYDFPDQALRLSFGNVSTDLLSASGTSVGLRLDKSLSYASDSYRNRSYIEEFIVVEKISDVQILNDGREIFRRTLQPGNYRLQDFILYNGANEIDIIITPLDGTDVQERHFNVNYNASLITPGDFYYGVALTTGRNITTRKSDTDLTLSIPYFNNRYLEYNPLNLALSAYIQAGFGEGVSFSGTLAANNRPSGDVLFIPSFRLSTELTHVNVLGTTRYNLNVYENSESNGQLMIPYVNARIGHQVSTGIRELSSFNISLGYTSPTDFENRPDRHYFQGSIGFSGSIFGLGWSLSGSSSLYLDRLDQATYSVSGSLSYSLGRNLFLSGSIGVSGIYGGESNVYGQVSASVRFGRTSIGVNASNSYYTANASSTIGRHSVSAEVRTNDLANIDDYSMRASYSYSGDYVNFNTSYNAYDLFNRSNLNFSLSTSSILADGLFAVSSYIPSNFLLIKQEGVLKGNEISVGNIGYSNTEPLKTTFGTALYPSVSTRGESLAVFSTDPDSFGTQSSFNITIPPSRRQGYVLRINSESKYSLSSLVMLPDGSLWLEGSSPLYEYTENEDGTVSLEQSDYYIFTDQDGRFILNDILPGTYAFDVPYNGSWILYKFTLTQNDEEYGNMFMYEGSKEFEINTGTIPLQYSLITDLNLHGYMTSDEFWSFLFPSVEDAI